MELLLRLCSFVADNNPQLIQHLEAGIFQGIAIKDGSEVAVSVFMRLREDQIN
ncbi:MAG: hypothetical protein AAGA89_14375 [Pseudomonadota bacterium]